tara:strand:+ start:4106 stop:4648 length:543 start_codon:yes stop_codon:yes gene_type:complete
MSQHTYNTIRLKLNTAKWFTDAFHRHSKPLKRHKFSIGAVKNTEPGIILGIVTVDICSSHAWSQRSDHIEIRRLVIRDDGYDTKNVASYLLGKAITACFAMGYKSIITYTQPGESGSSLMALGFQAQKFKAKKYTDKTYEGLIQWCLTEDFQKNPDFEFTKTNLIKYNDFVEGYKNRKFL